MGNVDHRKLKPHRGQFYQPFLGELSRATKVGNYLEIGVATGETFSQISCHHGIAVDPGFIVNTNIAKNKRRVSMFQLKSDDFFTEETARDILGGPVDFAFLDGMHLFEFLLRDIYNTEALATKQSLIVLHDCLPLTAIMADRSTADVAALSSGTPYHGWWTGDVWKVIPILRRYRPDLRVILADAPPTGLVILDNLDPTSDVLKRAYDEIVHEYAGMPNDFDAIARIVDGNAVTATDKVFAELSQRQLNGNR